VTVSGDAGEWPLDTLDVDSVRATGWRPVAFRQYVLKLHARCNLACDYCYLYEMGDSSWRDRPRLMAPATLDRACARIVEHVQAHAIERLQVVFHGGEPLLAGPEPMARAATTLRAALPAATHVDFVVQTNGVLLTEAVLDRLHEHDIRVGVSLDGDRTDHDRHRRYSDGRGSHEDVERALALLTGVRHRRLFAGLLCVVDLDADPVATYEALLRFGPPRVDLLLPHGNWTDPPAGLVPGSGHTPYGDWLVAAFDRWYGAPVRETEVRLFADVMHLLLGGASRSEQVGLSPVALIVVDTDGSMEQVDTLRSAYHGAAVTGLNVYAHPFDAALDHPAVVARQLGTAALGADCRRCDIRDVCGGGYYPHRYRRGSGFRQPSVYCADMRRLIEHVDSRMRTDIAALLAARAG
jgi:uncharacterized protein